VRIRLPRKWKAKLSLTKKLNIENLKEEQMRKKYQDEILKQLNERPQTEQNRWNNIKKTITLTATKSIGYRTKKSINMV
jgi:1,2-phenylacetyl-CoA epoxidase catalytic subunit